MYLLCALSSLKFVLFVRLSSRMQKGYKYKSQLNAHREFWQENRRFLPFISSPSPPPQLAQLVLT